MKGDRILYRKIEDRVHEDPAVTCNQILMSIKELIETKLAEAPLVGVLFVAVLPPEEGYEVHVKIGGDPSPILSALLKCLTELGVLTELGETLDE